MSVHRSVRLGPGGRRRIVEAVEGGMSQKRAAARFCVSPATVNRWVVRARQASPEERASGACFEERSCRPHNSPRMLSAADHDRVCAVRERTGWGPRLIAGEVGIAHATVHRALRRRGCSRRPRRPREPVRRYEWPCPGNLLHMDTKRHARFVRPGHAVTGDRTRNSRGAGFEFVHTLEDDCSRLAYAEVHDDEQAQTVTAFTERALDWFLDHGIVPERLLTDNAWCYTKNKGLRELLFGRAIIHKRTRPYTPRTNGKVERLQQTMDREWARGLTYNSSADRRAALPHWLHHYNTRRRHSELGDQTPISRVHKVLGQDI
jgi:transposase InsO family protein